MKRFSIIAINISLLLLALIFSCNKKPKVSGDTDKPVIENSYNLEDFVIQDGADGQILDREDEHRIQQHTVAEVEGGAVDTIYFQVAVDLDKLKLKPRFYEAERVSSVDPDTTKIHDFTKYDEKDYPTMKVTFNTGLVRTFAIVAGKITDQKLIDLVANQREHFISEYTLEKNGTPLTNADYKEVLIKHTPVLGDKIIKDTIEIYLTSGSTTPIKFTPIKYGVSSTITATAVPQFLEIDPVLENDKNTEAYKTILCTFPNGFQRQYAVRVIRLASLFTDFKVLNGSNIAYAKADCTLIANGESASTLLIDKQIIIVPPLLNNTLGRNIQVQFSNLAAGTTATVEGFESTDKPTGTALDTDGKMNIDFSAAPNDSVKLTLDIGSTGTNKQVYTIKLLTGINYKTIKEVIDATGSKRDIVRFPNIADMTKYDHEVSIAVDKKYVYVLKLVKQDESTIVNWGDAKRAYTDVQTAKELSIYAYDISSGTGTTGSAIKVTPPAEEKMVIISMFSISDVLHGIGIDVTPTVNTSGTADCYIYKWDKGIEQTPTKVSTSKFGTLNLPYSANLSIDNSTVYISPVAGNLTGGSNYTRLGSLNATTTNWAKYFAAGGGGAQGSILIEHPKKKDFFNISSGAMTYYNQGWMNSTSVNATDSFKNNKSNGLNMSLSGGNIHTIRDKDYLFTTEMYVTSTAAKVDINGGGIFDLGKDLTDLKKGKLESSDGKTPDNYLITLRKKHFTMPTDGAIGIVPVYHRGGCRTYVLEDGTIRVAYLINGIGFKVYDIK